MLEEPFIVFENEGSLFTLRLSVEALCIDGGVPFVIIDTKD